MGARDFIEPVVHSAQELVAGEVDYWRDEITRPWREGRRGRPARIGRWIGLGLAVGAVAAGVIAALRVERPWE